MTGCSLSDVNFASNGSCRLFGVGVGDDIMSTHSEINLDLLSHLYLDVV